MPTEFLLNSIFRPVLLFVQTYQWYYALKVYELIKLARGRHAISKFPSGPETQTKAGYCMVLDEKNNVF
jgi:hypothetical protein